MDQLSIRARVADKIWQWRNITYTATSALVLLAIVAVFLSISSPSSIIEVSEEPTFFDAERAHRNTRELARLYPDRDIGSDEARGAASWYADTLDSLEIPYTEEPLTAPLGDSTQTMRNIAVVFPGAGSETIVVTAPREPSVAPELFPLANASGTAILLELTQVFAARPHDKTFVFLSTEGGSYGGVGLAHYLDTDDRIEDVAATLSIRGLGKEQRDKLMAGVVGPGMVTPGWYVELATSALDDPGISLELPPLHSQIADHALALYPESQAAGLKRGIPSLLLHDESGGTVTAAGLATQGAALERLLLSLDGGSRLPSGPNAALVLPNGRFVTNRALAILGVLMLLPGAVMALTWLGTTTIRPDAWMRHLRNVLSFGLPLGLLASAGWLGALAGIIPRYSGYVPPVESSNISPRLVPTLLLLLLAPVFFLASRHFLGYLKPQEPRAMTETVKLSLGLVVLIVGLGLLTSQSPFMLIAGLTTAWMWPLVSCFAEPSRVILPWKGRSKSNMPILLAGLIAPAMLYAYLVIGTDVSWWQGWWFLIVQMVSGAYGLRGPVASVLITTGFLILLGVKRLELIPVETLEERNAPRAPIAPERPRVRKVERPSTRQTPAERNTAV